MTKRSIFFDEWQACLRAHYIHVIRTNDVVTERTLRTVLQQSGLSDADLQQLVDEAFALGAENSGEEILLEQDRVAAEELPAEIVAISADEETMDESPLLDEIPLDEVPLADDAATLPLDETPAAEDAAAEPIDGHLNDGELTENDFNDDEPPEPPQPPSPHQLSMF